MANEDWECISISSGDSGGDLVEVVVISEDEQVTTTTSRSRANRRRRSDVARQRTQTNHGNTNILTETVFHSAYEEDLQSAITLSLQEFEQEEAERHWLATVEPKAPATCSDAPNLTQASPQHRTDMGHDLCASDSLEAASRSSNSVRVEHKSSEILNDCNSLPTKKPKLSLSAPKLGTPDIAVASGQRSCSANNSSSQLETLSSRDPLGSAPSTPEVHIYKPSFSNSHFHKKLNLVKTEVISDGELSDSLPDLEQEFDTPVVELVYFENAPHLEPETFGCDIFLKNKISSSDHVGLEQREKTNDDYNGLEQSAYEELLQKKLKNLAIYKDLEDISDADSSSIAADTETVVENTLKESLPTSNLTKKCVFSPVLKDRLKRWVLPKKYSSSRIKRCSDNVDHSSDGNSDAHRSSSSERHFLDIFPGSPSKKVKLADEHGQVIAHEITTVVGNVPTCELTTETNKGCLRTETSATCSVQAARGTNSDVKYNRRGERIEKSKSLTKSNFSCTAQKLRRKTLSLRHRTRRPGYKWPNSPLKSRKFVLQELPKRNSKVLFPSFLTDFALPDHGVKIAEHRVEFTSTQINAVDASIEEGNCFMSHVVDLAQGFSFNNSPPESVVGHIYKTGLLNSKDIKQSLKSFNTLSYIQRKFPRAISVSWAMICEIADTIGLDKPILTTDKSSMFNCSLALQLIIQVLRGELRTIDLSDPQCIRRCQAYKVLSEDHQFNNLKQIMDWITRIITCNMEYKELCESYISIHMEGEPDPHKETPAEKLSAERTEPATEELKTVLPFLQQLLEIGVLTSTSNTDCARRLAELFVRIISILPNLEHKKLLLQTMTSDLLRFKICQLFLETQCDAPQCCLDFPMSLQEVVESFFQAVPSQSQLTPPLSPNDEDLNDLDEVLSYKGSPESCEQLCVIQYYGLSSYIKCIKSQCYKALRRRGTRDKLSYHVSEADRRILRDEWAGEVEALRGKILELSGDLTPVTEQYLAMILCLGETA